LEAVVGSELDGVLPIDLEDMVYAFEQLPKLPEPVQLERMPTDEEVTLVGGPQNVSIQHGRVAEPAMGMRLLAAATLQERALELINALRANGVEARGLLASPAPYARLAEKIVPPDADPICIVDIGHMRTDVCLALGGKPIYARSIARGGHHITRLLARTWNVDYQRATSAKHTDAFVTSQTMPANSQGGEHMSETLSKELRPLVRELKRTLSACRAKTGFEAGGVLLVGGGSRLRGIGPYLAENLGLPVELVSSETSMRILGESAASASLDTCALAVGVAIDGSSAKPSFDLRQGALAFKADLSFLRTKVRTLAIAAVAIMAFFVISAKTGISKLRKAEEILDRRVALESAEAIGESLSAKEVLERVGPVKKGGKVKLSPIPDMTAYDMLLAFNSALPKKDKAVLDVSEIDIKPGKLIVKAASSPLEGVSALQGIKNLEESLKASKCFKEFTSPESQPAANESRSFTLTIKSTCNN
jgi:general secretion pathway protein L